MSKQMKKRSGWYLVIGIVFIVSGFTFISKSISEAVISIAIGAVLIYVWYPKNLKTGGNITESKEIKPVQAMVLNNGKTEDLLNKEWTDVDRKWEIINNSLAIISTTVNADTFFSRYNLIFKLLEEIIEVDGKNNSSVVEELEKLKRSKPQYVDAFIDKMWDDTCKKMQNLKTDRGKMNRANKFKEELKKYESEMTAENIQRYVNKKFL